MLLLVMIALIRIAPTDSIIRFLLSERFGASVALAAVVFLSTGLASQAQDLGTGIQQNETSSADKLPTKHELLREGTLIPPTEGRIIPVGRRWGFAPTSPHALSPMQMHSDQDQQHSLTGRVVSKPRPTRLGFSSSVRVMTVADSGRSVGATPNGAMPAQPNATETTGNPRLANARTRLIILSENLMLQRIVESVLADSADDSWTISGEITEFRNQNRLRIHTAQRTNEHQ